MGMEAIHYSVTLVITTYQAATCTVILRLTSDPANEFFG